MKLCECGCGWPTNLAPFSHPKNRWIKGEPLRFIKGHSRRGRGSGLKAANGYRYILLPNHPNANGDGYVKLATVLAARVLGRAFRPKEIVHHIDGDRSNDATDNLLICTQSYHMAIHRCQERRAKNVR